jgi:hypothetical protein
MNRLQTAVRDYLAMRRSLGFKRAKHEGGLRGVPVVPCTKTQFTHNG